MINGMAAFMAQQLEAPLRSPALDFEHLMEFERLQTRMREIERNGNGGDTCRREPLVTQIAGGAEGETTGGNLVVKLCHAPFQFTAFDANAEVANAPGQ